MFSFALPAILLGMPAAYELDFRVLTAEPNGSHTYTIVMSFKGEPDVRILTAHQRKYGPQGAADFFVDGLDDPRWKFKQNGPLVTVFGYDDVRVAKITIEGTGQRPLVRKVPNFTVPKK